MKKDFGSKSWLYPMPVLIVSAYDEQGVPNVMNAAWGGMFTDETIGICLSAGHKTTKNILATRPGIKSPTNSPGRDFMPLLRHTSMPR